MSGDVGVRAARGFAVSGDRPQSGPAGRRGRRGTRPSPGPGRRRRTGPADDGGAWGCGMDMVPKSGRRGTRQALAGPFARFDTRAGYARDDGPRAEPGQLLGGEVCLVRAEFDRTASARPAPGADGRYPAHQRRECEYVVRVRGRDRHGHGMPWASDKTCGLLPFLPRSTDFGPVSAPPSGASRGRVDDGRCPLQLTSGAEFVQHGPVVSGTCRQAHPLVSTYTTVVSTARSSRGAFPPPADGS